MTTQQQGESPDTSHASAICATAIACPTQAPFCPQPGGVHTWFQTCGIPPVTVYCNQQAQGQAANVGNTGWQTCGHVPTCGDQTKIVATTYTQINCGQTHLLGCTTATGNPDTSNAQAATIGHTGWQTCGQSPTCGNQTNVVATTWTQITCGQTNLPGCIGITATEINCAHTQLLGCTTATGNPDTSNAQAATIGHTGWYTCGYQGTAATVCTQVACHPNTAAGCPQPQAAAPTTTVQPTHLLGCTGWHTCGQPGTMATVCTQVACHPNTAAGCPQAQLGAPAPTTTVQPTHLLGCTGWYTCTQPGTMATVCTQITCGQTHRPGCTTVTTPPQTLDCPQAMGAAPTTTVQHTHAPGCNIGYTGWYTCGQVPTCGNQTKIVATTYTQINCGQTHFPGCTTVTTPPNTLDCPQPMGTAQAPTATTTVQPTHLPNCHIGYTGWFTCTQPGTAATVCTRYGCAPTRIGCVPTHKPGCVGPTGWYTCTHPGTAATVCTQINC